MSASRTASDLLRQQLAIQARCSHRADTFIEFRKEEIEQSIPDRFVQQVSQYPERLAIKHKNHELTYDQLNKAANRVAQAILGQRGEGQEPVALLFEHGIAGIVAILGTLKAGKISVSMDPSHPPIRLTDQLKDSRASLIMTNRRNLSLAGKLTHDGCQLIDTDEIDAGLSTENPGLSLSPDDLAYIISTSGSTGEPKGIVHSHRTALHLAMRHTNGYHLCADDRLTHLRSYSVGSSQYDIFGALLNGAALYPFDLKEEGMDQLPNWLIEEEITAFYPTPTVFRHFIDVLTEEVEFPHLRLIILGSEALYKKDLELCQRYFSRDCLLVHRMGSTESGLIQHYFIGGETPITTNRVPVGYPAQDMEVLLLDGEGNEMVGSDCVGEIAVRSRYLPVGYWQRPQLTQTAYLSDPNGGEERTYRTGDLGRRLPDGCLVHLGRKDFQVKIRGHRVEVSEIEQALLSLDNILEAAVVAWEDQPENKRLVAYVVPAAEPVPTVSALRGALAEKLPEYMLPSAFLFLEILPITPTGKVDRKALPPPGRARPELETPLVAPGTTVEEKLAELWTEVLGLDEVGIHDDFFALGGHSLLAMRLFAQIEKTFGRKLSPAALLQAPTVERLGKIVSGEKSFKGSPALVAIQPNGSRPPFFCSPGGDGNNLEYRELALHLGADQPFYGLQAPGLEGDAVPLKRIEDLASYFIEGVCTFQPQGPYFLGGECFGGMVAFEMSRQLTAQGQTVALLALIETPVPPVTMSKTACFFKAPKLLQPSLMRRLGLHLHNLVRVDFKEKLDYICQSFKNLSRRRRPETDWRVERQTRNEQLPEAVQNLRKVSSRAFKSYMPQPYVGRITLFNSQCYRPKKRPIQKSFLPAWLDRRLDWVKWAGGGLEVKWIPGDHRTVLREPHVSVLAQQLKTCLLEAQKQAPRQR